MSYHYAAMKLAEKLQKNLAHKVTVDEYGTVLVHSPHFAIHITHRPWYCDRGKYLLYCESRDQRVATVDCSDGFPRYYFKDQSLCVELKAWLEAREQHIKLRENTGGKASD